MIKKEFDVSIVTPSQDEMQTQERYGLFVKRYLLTLPKEKSRQLEYERFSSVKVDLTLRSSLQHAWFDVKGIFDKMSSTGLMNQYQANQLAQVSYLLKMADAEMSRIRESLSISDDHSIESPHADHSKQQYEEAFSEHEEEVSPEWRDKFKEQVEEYILKDHVVRKLDRIIADYYNAPLRYDEEFVVSVADMFLKIHASTIEAIRDDVKSNEKTIISMVKFIFGDTSTSDVERINKGSCLLILFYVLIAQTGSVEVITNSVGKFVNLHGTSPDDFANNLLFYYKKSIKHSQL